MKENTSQKGYITTTQKYRLYTNHIKYLKLTQEIYNQTILTYYNLLFSHLEFLNLSNQRCLRELEKLTLKSKTGKKPINYIDINIPVYLRRAAINHAIGSVRSYETNYKRFLEKQEQNPKQKLPEKATKFNASIVCYKGMYKDLLNDKIKLKLFNGETWKWYTSTIKGANFKESDEILSPTIVIEKEYVMIHIPIQKQIEDVTPIKQRMNKEKIKVCGIAFSNSDSFAICVVLDEKRNFIKAKFIKGGKEYKNKTSKILSTIKKHRQNGSSYGEKDHKSYWQKLNNISENYAHKVSKEIVDFCKENKVEVISIADMEEDVSKHFGKRVGKYSPIYLRKRIEKYLSYKAFKNGILVTKVRRNYIASKCYICRGNIKRNKLKYECENGHTGDYFFNSAMNIALMCLKKFGKWIKELDSIKYWIYKGKLKAQNIKS